MYILKNYILGGHKIFGEVQDYAYKFEAQGRGSLHVHCVIWLKHTWDVEKTEKGILAMLPCDVDDDNNPVIPSDPMHAALAEVFIAKQIHKCSSDPGGCKYKTKTCKMHFPNPRHESDSPCKRRKLHRFQYMSLRSCDNYVVPTHVLLALLFRSHTNMQKCVNEQWCSYLLKYTMKANPSGFLRPLQDLYLKEVLKEKINDPYAIEIAASYAMVTPISPCELCLPALGIDSITLSREIAHVECKPPMGACLFYIRIFVSFRLQT